MTVRVGKLVSELRNRSRVMNVRLSDVSLIAEGDEAGSLRVGGTYYDSIEDVPIEQQGQVISQIGQRVLVGGDRFPWGDRNTQAVCNFLKVPYKYVSREPIGWQRDVIRHHTDKNRDLDTMWYVEGDSISGIYPPDAKVIPLSDVAERIANVFDPDDLANVLLSPDQVEVNVISRIKTVTVPGIEGFAGRPLDETVEDPHTPGRKVGDLSAGGIRVIIQPGKPERAPVVQEYWERLVCTNGMTRMISGSEIKLRGRTVPEILDELENVARAVFEGLEESGRAIRHSAEIPVPGAVSDFIRQAGREHGISAATILRLQERAAGLPFHPSMYDVTQIITSMANEDGVPVLTRRNLQALGGDNVLDTARMVHRCTQCERPLAA